MVKLCASGAPQAAIADGEATPVLQKPFYKAEGSSLLRYITALRHCGCCHLENKTARFCAGEKLRFRVFVATQKFIPFDCGYDADGALVARLGALDAAEAAHAHRTSHSDFVR